MPRIGLPCAFHVWPLPYWPDWFSFGEVLLPPQRNPGALIEWPSGSQSPPWLWPFSPDRPVCMGGWWFQTSPTHRWWRPLCSLGPSKQKNFFSNPSSGLSLEIVPVLSWRSPDNSIHPAWFAQHATVGPYMNRYVPFQIMSIQINSNKQNTLCIKNFVHIVIMGDCV